MKPQNIVCRRTGTSRLDPKARTHVNLPQMIVQHSPDGFEWGYGGSGPADLALNILHLFLPVGCDGEDPVPLFRGECSKAAWTLHQDFKRAFIATMPDEGGVITVQQVYDWLAIHWPGFDHLSRN